MNTIKTLRTRHGPVEKDRRHFPCAIDKDSQHPPVAAHSFTCLYRLDMLVLLVRIRQIFVPRKHEIQPPLYVKSNFIFISRLFPSKTSPAHAVFSLTLPFLYPETSVSKHRCYYCRVGKCTEGRTLRESASSPLLGDSSNPSSSSPITPPRPPRIPVSFPPPPAPQPLTLSCSLNVT